MGSRFRSSISRGMGLDGWDGSGFPSSPLQRRIPLLVGQGGGVGNGGEDGMQQSNELLERESRNFAE